MEIPSLKHIKAKIVQHHNEMLWVTIGQILSFGGGFAGIKILTSTMGPTGYGQLALGLTIAGFINTFFYGPLSQTFLRFFSIYEEKGLLPSYFYILKRVNIFVVSILLVFLIIAAFLVYYFINLEWSLILIISILFGIVTGINVTFNAIQGAVRQRKVVALHQGADSCLRPALAILLVYLFKNSGYYALVGYLLGTTCIVLSQRYFIVRNKLIKNNLQFNINDELKGINNYKDLINYTLSFMAIASLAMITLYADKWIVQGLLGTYEVGIYSAISQIANAPIVLFIGMISQFVAPIIFERAGTTSSISQIKNSNTLLNYSVIASSIVLVGIVFVAFLWGEIIIKLLTSDNFAKYYHILWVMALGVALYNIAQILFLKGQSYLQPHSYLLAWTARAGSFIVIGFFLTKYFGLMGMALGSCMSSLIFLIAVIYKNIKMNVNFNGTQI